MVKGAGSEAAVAHLRLDRISWVREPAGRFATEVRVAPSVQFTKVLGGESKIGVRVFSSVYECSRVLNFAVCAHEVSWIQ